jgi:hypothetical protein
VEGRFWGPSEEPRPPETCEDLRKIVARLNLKDDGDEESQTTSMVLPLKKRKKKRINCSEKVSFFTVSFSMISNTQKNETLKQMKLSSLKNGLVLYIDV